MRFLFRYDYGPPIGNGHKGRCAPLIQAAEDQNHEVLYATRPQADAHNALTGSPHNAIHADELEQFERFIRTKGSIDWIILDHYGYTDSLIAALKAKLNVNVLVMDDHQQRRAADLRWAPFSQAVNSNDLIGPEYTLINPVFFEQHTENLSLTLPIETNTAFNLVCFGTADPKHVTQALIKAIDSKTQTHWLVLASKTMQTEQTLDTYAKHLKVHLIEPVEAATLAALFKAANATLVSASTLALEAVSAGAHLIAFESMDNQRQIANGLRQIDVPVFTDITKLMHFVQQNPYIHQHPSALDANGAKRVLARIQAFQ